MSRDQQPHWHPGKMVYATAVLLAVTAIAHATACPPESLVARYLFNDHIDNRYAVDSSGKGHHGTIHNAVLTSNRLGNGSSAYSFNGKNAYIEISDHPDFSVSTTGQLSIAVWMRPGTLNFPHDEKAGYVHWMGKGVENQHEWAFRMYSMDNTEDRPNRTSFYLFNLRGNLRGDLRGAGSYVEKPVRPGEWYHYVAVVDMSTDTITWYRNGEFEASDPFMNSIYHITPQRGTAPVRIGTRDFNSHFKGAIDNIHIYNRALSASEVRQLYEDTTP